LIQYSSYRALAAWLSGRLVQNAGFHSRSAELPEELIPAVPDIFRNMTADMLAAAAARALAAADAARVDTSHVTSITVSLEEMVKQLSRRIAQHGRCDFREVCGDKDRMRVVVSFLALLELYRTGKVELHQDDPFSGITIMWNQRMAEEVQ
jgi:segregation and condensation protein A